MKKNHSFYLYRIINNNNIVRSKFNETYDYNEEKGNFDKSKNNMRLILPPIKSITPNNDNHIEEQLNLIVIKPQKKLINKNIHILHKKLPNLKKEESKKFKNQKFKIKNNNKIPYDFKNIKILGNNENNIIENTQNSNSTISHLSVFHSIKNRKKSSSISLNCDSIFSLSEEENIINNIKKEIDTDSFKKFCKKINDILNLNIN
jgi:hypothetical protein